MECAICLNSVRKTRHTRELDCKHVFHSECFEQWTNNGGTTCPLCREPIHKSLYRISITIENIESGNVQTHSTTRRSNESDFFGIDTANIVFEVDQLNELTDLIQGGFFGLRESDFDSFIFNTE